MDGMEAFPLMGRLVVEVLGDMEYLLGHYCSGYDPNSSELENSQ